MDMALHCTALLQLILYSERRGDRRDHVQYRDKWMDHPFILLSISIAVLCQRHLHIC